MPTVVTLARMKEFLTVDYAVQDDVIEDLIDGAEEYVARVCGRELSQQTHAEDLDGGGYALWPTHAPVASVSSVVDNESGAAVSDTDYVVSGDYIVRDDGDRWDDSPARRWRVTYTGGDSSVPEGLKVVVMKLVSRWFQNRDGKDSQGAAGFSVDWTAFSDSDIMRALEPYRSARSMIG